MSDSFQDRLARLNANAPAPATPNMAGPEPDYEPEHPREPGISKLVILGFAVALLLPSLLGVGYVVLSQGVQTAMISTVDDLPVDEAAKRAFAPETVKANASINLLLARAKAGLIADEERAYYQTPEGKLELQMMQSKALGGVPGLEAMAKYEFENAQHLKNVDP